jgi:hypothetical protein
MSINISDPAKAVPIGPDLNSMKCCPFCGATPVLELKDGSDRDDNLFRVVCPCGVAGSAFRGGNPYSSDPDKDAEAKWFALRSWNKRAKP